MKTEKNNVQEDHKIFRTKIINYHFCYHFVSPCHCLGLMVGYGFLGGGNPSNIFNHDLWNEVMTKLSPGK